MSTTTQECEQPNVSFEVMGYLLGPDNSAFAWNLDELRAVVETNVIASTEFKIFPFLTRYDDDRKGRGVYTKREDGQIEIQHECSCCRGLMKTLFPHALEAVSFSSRCNHSTDESELEGVPSSDEQQEERIQLVLKAHPSTTGYRYISTMVKQLDASYLHSQSVFELVTAQLLSQRTHWNEQACHTYLAVRARQEAQKAQEAVTELVTKWGYRDVTALFKALYNGNIDYLYVLQKPNGVPLYCRSAQAVFEAVEHVRSRPEERTAPEPSEELWILIGDFNLDE